MKKLAKIQDNDNGLTIMLDGTATFVKIFNRTGKMIRHSRIQGKDQLTFLGSSAEYYIESDGSIEEITSENFQDITPPKLSLGVLSADDDGVKAFSVMGIPASPDRVKALVRKKLFTDDDVKNSITTYYDRVERRLTADIIPDDITKKLALGTITATEKTKLKKAVADITKEKERVKKLVGATKNLEDLLKVKSKFKTLTKINPR